MSKRHVVRFNGVRFGSKAELRSQKSIVLPNDFVDSKILMPGQRVALSIKAGHRRKMFTGTLWANHYSCSCHTGVEFYSVEK